MDQIKQPRFVVADTMDLWINIARGDLEQVIKRVDLMTMNESEVTKLTGEKTLVKAAHALLKMGPEYVIIKKGEHGSILFGHNRLFLMPAFPVENVRDPTGAGDSFAGGFTG